MVKCKRASRVLCKFHVEVLTHLVQQSVKGGFSFVKTSAVSLHGNASSLKLHKCINALLNQDQSSVTVLVRR